MRRPAAAGLVLAFVASKGALANPWPAEIGSGEIITSGTAMRTETGLASGFSADAFSGFYADYGLTDDVTLIANGGVARHMRLGENVTVFDSATVGSRIPLKRWDYAILSGEILGGIAGVQQPNAPASAIALAGTGVVRLMLGDGFTLFRRHAFAQIEAGWRWRAGAPADELEFNAGAGIEPWSTGLLMLQSFSTASVGTAEGAYRRYQLVKLQFSVAQRLSSRLWLQIGGLETVAGSGAGDLGAMAAAWWRF